MIVSSKPEVGYAVVGRCGIAATVLCDAKADRFHVLVLGKERADSDREVAESIAAGLTQQAGVLGITETGELQVVARPGFQWVMTRASVVFRHAILQCRAEILELERLARLADPRAQA